MTDLTKLGEVVEHHPALAAGAAAAGLGAAVAATLTVRWLIRAGKRKAWSGEDVGTFLAAAIATGVSAQGMWHFMGQSLGLPIALRMFFFAFIEVMVVTSALRARKSQLATGSSGVDGLAMWVLTCLSGVLASTDTDNFGAFLIRLSAPLVAAWGWERSMALERQHRTGRKSGLNWRITPARMLTRLGLADPDQDRTASEAAAQRRLLELALAVEDVRVLRDATRPRPKALERAQGRLRRAMRRAVEDGGMVPFDGRERTDVLVDLIATLRGTTALVDLDTAPPWMRTIERTVTAPAAAVESSALNDELATLLDGAVDEHQRTEATDDTAPSAPAAAVERTADLITERTADLITERTVTAPPVQSPTVRAAAVVSPPRGQRQPVPVALAGPGLRAARPDASGMRPGGGSSRRHGSTGALALALAPVPVTPDWRDIAACVCASGSGRRDPEQVEQILRAKFDHDDMTAPSNATVGERVGCNASTVKRIVDDALKHMSGGPRSL